MRGHTDEVQSVALSADESCAVTGSRDGTVRVWGLRRGVCKHVLSGHEGAAWEVAIAPDGQTAVSGGSDNTLRVWDLVRGSCRRLVRFSYDSVYKLRIFDDGKRALAVMGESLLRVFNLGTGDCERELWGHRESVNAAVVVNRRRAISASQDGDLRVWNLDAHGKDSALPGDERRAWGLFPTADGRRAIAGVGETLSVWDVSRARAGYCNKVVTRTYIKSRSSTADDVPSLPASRCACGI